MVPALLGVWLALTTSVVLAVGGQGPEVVAAVRIHGNLLTPDADILAIAAVPIGAPVAADTTEAVRGRLDRTGRFGRVQVLKRYASIADPTRVLLVIVVDEGPVAVRATDEATEPVRIARRRWTAQTMVLPVVRGEEGYGLTYGARLAWVGLGGPRGRVSVPLTWGGTRRAGVDYDRSFSTGPVTRVRVGAAIESGRHPSFDERIGRRGVSARAERAFGRVRVGSTAGWQRVRFEALDDRVRTVGADVVVDTRLDPLLPRNAVYAALGLERLTFDTRAPVRRLTMEGRGYLGLVGPSVLVARAIREDADGQLPPYLQPVLGGWSNLRGFEPGAFVGDRLVAGSIELRVPLSSALRLGKFGVSMFADVGKVYRNDQRFGDEPLRWGMGGGVWYTITAVQVGAGVAHAHGGGTRATFGADLRY